MIKRIANLAVLSLLSLSPRAQHDPGDLTIGDAQTMLARGITAEELKGHVMSLASDAFEGRETGTPGNFKAAEYIQNQFISSGLSPVPHLNSYTQEVAFTRIKWDAMTFMVNGVPYKHMYDFLSAPSRFPLDSISLSEAEVVFMGYGIDTDQYSDYKGQDVSGKVILIYQGEPFDKNGNSYITGSKMPSAWSNGLDLKLKAAKKYNVKAVLVIQDNLLQKVSEERRFLLRGRTIMGDGLDFEGVYVPYFEVSTTLAEDLLGRKKRKVIKSRKKIVKKGQLHVVDIPATLEIKAVRERKYMPGDNVLGYIEGIDPGKKDELVVITAHYDHLGKRGESIYYGANDNASGTSAIIEIAEAFEEASQQGYGPARSVLCMLVTGEEKGLLGSEYYTERPVFPIENTVANVNIDMIGRKDVHHTDHNYVYVIGADRLSTELHEINESVNARYTGLELDYTYNDPDDPNQFYARSDHYNFAKLGVPAIFYFNGVHDDYHRPGDTPDKINYEAAATIARLAFYTAWELANREERIKVDMR